MLTGIRILDLSRVLAGPFCTMLAVDMGAEVIKVERPDVGDDSRHFAPFDRGESGYFMLINRGKKSVAIDLKKEAGLQLFRQLTAHADVVVENFRPGVTERLGIDYASLRELKSDLVYLSISGFGQTSPYRDRPAYDLIAQAMSGLMSVTGPEGGPPTRVGESVGDLVSGLYGLLGIAGALLQRERTGEGQYLDVAMMDSLFSLLITAFTLQQFGGITPAPVGNRHPLSSPFDTFQAKDGHVVIAVANDVLFRRLAIAIGEPGLPADSRFETDALRTRHVTELKALIEAWTSKYTVQQVVAHLGEKGIPVSPIYSLDEVVADEHVAARQLLTGAPHPVSGQFEAMRLPLLGNRVSRVSLSAPPRLGQHTEQILHQLLGMSNDEIRALKEAGVIEGASR